MRRPILIVAFVLVVIGIGVLIYFLFFKGMVTPANNANNAGTNGTLPISNNLVNRITANTVVNGLPIVNGSVTNVDTTKAPEPIARGGRTITQTVTDGTAISPASTTDGSTIVYYDPATGKFYKVSRDAKTRIELTSQTFPDAQSVVWSPTRDRAIIAFPDQSRILYNFTTQVQTTLPKEWSDVTFSPDGGQVAYKYLSGDENTQWLAVSNPDGTEVKGIEPVGDKADSVQVAWSPNNQFVALYHSNTDATGQEVLPIGFNGENFQSFKVDGQGFDGKWSPTGDRLLYTTYGSSSNYNPSLTIANVSGQTVGTGKQALSIQTWVDKCAFSGDGSSLYCAVPNSLPEGSGIYRELSNSIPDTFWKIDLSTGLKTPVAIPVTERGTGSYSARNVFLSPGGQFIYFTDVSTGRLERIQLK